ncbi:DHA2 family efflux MFS transporter permease subunit [Paenibacillus sp. D2_2]|uniref:DHA2 family efflux MFS transporter permease subunit n=1 Tax=Paenibacillus sp. D2_2 TaxID=3073092 RepID=UPI0028150059|nr:DHA2 family efflux MFS transporter permease subunit [Paenibacillus sp. D2_2]WMT43277.1 DHA2 family efflux MFS transporter permease subunit [Paenibacillus sp. D2_2]
MERALQQTKPNYLLIANVMIGAFFAILCNTLMSNAIPTIMKAFDVGASSATWLTTGYMLVSGIIIPTSAFFLNKFSIRNLFLWSMGLFTIGTIIGGFAPNFTFLIIARIIQACGGSILSPLLMNLLYSSFPPEKRGKSMGLVGLILIFAPAIGPTISGLILEVASWEWLFHMIWPVTLIITIISFKIMKKDKETQPGSLDVLSVILSAIGFGGIIYGFSTASKQGWDSSIVIICLVAGVLGLAAFVIRQNFLEKPMLNFKIFLNPKYTLSILVLITTIFGMYSVMIPVPLFMQNILGMTALKSGLIMLPGAMIMGLLAPINGKLFDRFGIRPLILVGFPFMIVASVILGNLGLETASWVICITYAIRLIGVGMVQMPLQTNALNALKPEEISHGTAMNSTLGQTVGAITSSLIVTLISNRTVFHGKEMLEEQKANMIGMSADAIQKLKETISIDAFIAGNNDTFLFSIVIAVIGLVVGLCLKSKKKI